MITSNNEKELPDAFLRRCFFHFIRFPDAETMTRIVAVHFPDLKRELLSEALNAFYKLRDVPGLKKKPSTSELLDWLKLLLAEDVPPEALRTDDPRKSLPPMHGALLKNEQDVHLFEQLDLPAAAAVAARSAGMASPLLAFAARVSGAFPGTPQAHPCGLRARRPCRARPGKGARHTSHEGSASASPCTHVARVASAVG